MSTKRIIEDKDFCRIVIATRRGARNITMRVKPDGLYLTVPPYSKTDKVLSTLEQFRADLRERFRQVAVRPIDFSFRIEADCFRLSLSSSHLKCFTVRQMPSGEVTVFCPEHTDFSDEAVQKLIIRKSKFPQNPKRSVRFSGKRTKRSVQKRKARNTQKAETKVL